MRGSLRLALLALPISLSTQAAEVPEGHPDRKPLLEASHPLLEHEGAAFKVIRLWASERWGFLCALGQYKDGSLTQLGGNAELFLAVLERTPVWKLASGEVRFVEDPSTAGQQCRFRGVDTTKQLSDKLIEQALRTRTFHEESEAAFQAEHEAQEHYLAGRDKEAVAAYQTFIKEAASLTYPAEELRQAVEYDLFLAYGRLGRIYQRQKRNDLRDASLREALKHQTGTMNLKKPADVLDYVADVDSNHSKK